MDRRPSFLTAFVRHASAPCSVSSQTLLHSGCSPININSDLPGNVTMLAEGFNALASMGAMTPTPVCSASALWYNTTSTQCGCASASSATATAQYSTISGAPSQSACAFTASSDLGPPIPDPTNLVLLTCYDQTGPNNVCTGPGVSYSYVNQLDNTDCLPATGCNCINVVSFNISTVTWNDRGCNGDKSVWQASQNCSTWVNGNTSTPGTESIGFWPNCPGEF